MYCRILFGIVFYVEANTEYEMSWSSKRGLI